MAEAPTARKAHAPTSAGWSGAGEGDLPFLPYGRQTIEDDDIQAVTEALRADLLTTGPRVAAFETALAERVGAAHAVACSHGTAALHMAVMAAGLQPGDVAIVPAMTFLATANACRFEGAEVVFADVNPNSGLMTPETLAEALARARGRRVRAVLPVHLCGHPVDLPGIRRLADQAGAVVIEDACHALGAEGPSGLVGGCAEAAMACFSFHPVKTICTGEGGAVTTNDGGLAERLRRGRNHGASRNPADWMLGDLAFDGETPNPWWYEQLELGANYRLPDIACALGISQLGKLDRFIARRRELVAAYRKLLAPLAPAVALAEGPIPSNDALHLLVALIDFEAVGLSRRRVMEGLRAKGIGTQVHYIPVSSQPYYRGLYGEQTYPGAEGWYARALSLPLYPAMDDGDPERVVAALIEVLGL